MNISVKCIKSCCEECSKIDTFVSNSYNFPPSSLLIQLGTTKLTASTRSTPSARTQDVSTSENPPIPAPVDDDLLAGVSPHLNELTQGVSISEHLSTPAPVDDDLFANVFPRPTELTQGVSTLKHQPTHVPSVDEFFDKTFPRRNERTQGFKISEHLSTPAPVVDDPFANVFPRRNERTQGVSTLKRQSTPAPVDDDMLAVFPYHYEYPWNQRQPTAAELWHQQSSRAEVDDNPYSLAHVPRNDTQSQYLATPTLAHVPRNDTQSQYLATPTPGTPTNLNLGVRQIAAYDRPGPAFDERSIHQPRVLAQAFIPGPSIRPPPGLTHPNMARFSPSPVPTRPNHPSPGHVRATPQVPTESLLPYSPPTPRTVPRRFRMANIDTDNDPILVLRVAKVCHYKLCPMSNEC